MREPNMPTKAASAFALTAATGAVACAACCVLPLAFPAVALAGLGSAVALLANALVWVTVLAVAIVASAWAWVGWQSLRTRARPARSTLYMMGGATVLTAIVVMWRQVEPSLILALLG